MMFDLFRKWIKGLEPKSTWHPWLAERDARVNGNLARMVVAKWERGEREEAERVAAGLRRRDGRDRNEDALMVALGVLHGDRARALYDEMVGPKKWGWRQVGFEILGRIRV